MTDYSRLDEITLRNMLDSSYDFEERQQMRSALRRLKKHSNTVCCSSDRENFLSNNQSSVLQSRTSKWNNDSGLTPSGPFLRNNMTLGKSLLKPNMKHDPTEEKTLNDLIFFSCNGTTNKNSVKVIKDFNRTCQENVTNGPPTNHVKVSEENVHVPIEMFKQTLGKALSEPTTNNDLKLARSRLIIQQMLAPKLAAVTKQDETEQQRAAVTCSEQKVFKPLETRLATVRPNVDNNEPQFTRPLSDIYVAEGATVVLDCNVVAKYEPMILWYRNSQPVVGQQYEQSYNGDLAQLIVRNVDCRVIGLYECTARNAYGKVTSSCYLSITGVQQRVVPSPAHGSSPKSSVRRSETLPPSGLVMPLRNSAAARASLLRRMAAMRTPAREERLPGDDALGLVHRPEEVEEEAVARSTRTEKASDGGKVTTTTTVTTHKAKDGTHLVTKQTKQITRVGGVGTTNYAINKCSAEDIAERLAGIFEKKANGGTSGVVLVKTENWNSQDGITHRNEKSQIWEGPRLALSFNEADIAAKYNRSEDPDQLPGFQRNPTTVKQKLLEWCRQTLKDYRNVDVGNFSTSWNDGMAFCALIHHFIPDAFDYNQLDPKNRRENFKLAFETAEKRAGIVPLLEVEDMVGMTVPDWKCVFMYVQSIYRQFVLPKTEQKDLANQMEA